MLQQSLVDGDSGRGTENEYDQFRYQQIEVNDADILFDDDENADSDDDEEEMKENVMRESEF